MRTVGNLGARRMQPITALLVPVSVAALCVAGVVAPPALTLQQARYTKAELDSEIDELAQSAAAIARLDEDGGTERIQAAMARLQALIPDETPELELHGILRASAQVADLRLQSIYVSQFSDPELPRVDGDFVGLRQVRLMAEGDPDGFVRFVETLRSLGLPVSVSEFSVGRQATTFSISSTLNLFERTTPLSTNREDQDL